MKRIFSYVQASSLSIHSTLYTGQSAELKASSLSIHSTLYTGQPAELNE